MKYKHSGSCCLYLNHIRSVLMSSYVMTQKGVEEFT